LVGGWGQAGVRAPRQPSEMVHRGLALQVCYVAAHQHRAWIVAVRGDGLSAHGSLLLQVFGGWLSRLPSMTLFCIRWVPPTTYECYAYPIRLPHTFSARPVSRLLPVHPPAYYDVVQER
jgi:hypothetical protein